MVLLVYLEMTTEVFDAFRQKRNLDLGATRILVVQLELAYDLLFPCFPLFQHRYHFPTTQSLLDSLSSSSLSHSILLPLLVGIMIPRRPSPAQEKKPSGPAGSLQLSAVHADGCLPRDRADVLTLPAADAVGGDDVGSADGNILGQALLGVCPAAPGASCPSASATAGLVEVDGFAGHRAVLLTLAAVLVPHPGDALGAVDVGGAHLPGHLLLEREPLDGPGGADQAAEVVGGLVRVVALVDAEAHPGYQPGRPHSLQTFLQPGGLDGLFRADLHALPAADASAQELLLGPGAGGANETRLTAPPRRVQSENGQRQQPQGTGLEQEPTVGQDREPLLLAGGQGGADGYGVRWLLHSLSC